jgi:hypothetical protein
MIATSAPRSAFMTSPFVVAELCVDNARGRCVFPKIVGFAEVDQYSNFASLGTSHLGACSMTKSE